MKFGLIAAAAVAALAVGSATASAQYLVPHRGHYHVTPSYSPPLAYGGGYGYSGHNSGTYGGYASPGYGGYSSYPSRGYGGYSTFPSHGYGGNYGSGSWGGHHHHQHHHHGHHR